MIRLGKILSAHHVLNTRDYKQLVSFRCKNIFNIPNGVDSAYFKPAKKNENFDVLFMGRLVEGKGADLLPTIALKLVSKHIQIVVCGTGPLESLIKKCNMIKFLGFVDGHLKRELYAKSHVLIAPSRYETFMLTGLEAMASGTPVVTFDIPGPREYVVNGYNGFLVRSLDEMVEKVNKLYSLWKSGSQEYWEMCKNARKTAERFDWAVIIPKLEHMFHTVVKEHGNNQMQSH
ncbi:hypothetical protein B9Q02_10855 [Candidatus Marsarchaeota G1 archaeon BE_D]|uniref:Glycosyl transferase family 1 domain-containing protein n=1 Tax=Candidatus Marsarchaeota G1 archaeon BE_D TaxID=1978156 RepID=A0A2R6AA35_9ARCH|nr:MAG: hypothetical protein B9Q02_10855 [Candidatus Marsarchaeota G1 archaeon BE_D]